MFYFSCDQSGFCRVLQGHSGKTLRVLQNGVDNVARFKTCKCVATGCTGRRVQEIQNCMAGVRQRARTLVPRTLLPVGFRRVRFRMLRPKFTPAISDAAQSSTRMVLLPQLEASAHREGRPTWLGPHSGSPTPGRSAGQLLGGPPRVPTGAMVTISKGHGAVALVPPCFSTGVVGGLDAVRGPRTAKHAHLDRGHTARVRYKVKR
jgi:hypothetical protein